jgi:hypothetical protein
MMEMAELGVKNALLIPTPGQTEQEYLAEYYEKKGYYHSVDQDKLYLLRDVETAKGFSGFEPEWKTKNTVKNFMKVVGL